MDGHGDLSPLERSRLLRSVLDGGSGGGSAGGNGGHATSVSEYVGRSVTPTTLTLAQYHNSRYGLPSPMPGSNLAVMSSLISGAHNPEARKALLIDFQQYWSAHTDNFPPYIMTGGLYPSYPPLLPGTAESLSLLGAGVACVATGANTGAGPSHSHVAHYQRLLEMQKQACLASMSAAAAANHHSALYGISTNAIPSFLEHPAFTSHGAPPFGLVKQEPRELSCTEKTAKQGERRAVGFKVDLDLNRTSKEPASLPLASSMGCAQNNAQQLKEPKLSPSAPNCTSGRSDRRGSNEISTPGSSNGHRHVKKSFTHISTNSSLTPRHNSGSARSKCISPSSRPTQQASSSKGPSIVSKKVGSRSSHSIPRIVKTATSGQRTSVRTTVTVSSPSSVSLSESCIVSVPTQASAPIPLATVQHDGVVLSALASPSSAAASLASTKSKVLKQHTETINTPSLQDQEHSDKIARPSLQDQKHSDKIARPSLQDQEHSDKIARPSLQDQEHSDRIARPSLQDQEHSDRIARTSLQEQEQSEKTTIPSLQGYQHTDTISITSNENYGQADTGKSSKREHNPSETSTRQITSSPNFEEDADSRDQTIGMDNKNNSKIIGRNNNEVNGLDVYDDSRLMSSGRDVYDDSRLTSDDSSDIVVDSTDNDDANTSVLCSVLPRPDQNRVSDAATIDRCAASVENCAESDPDDATSSNCAKSEQNAANATTQRPSSGSEVSCVISCSGPASGTRTVYAKTQSVPSFTTSECAQKSSPISKQASASALPFYHTHYSKPQGVRRVHATTFVPEVGVFKGPSIKAMVKSSSSSGTSASPSDNRCRQDSKSAYNPSSFSPKGHVKERDSTPSPLLCQSQDAGSVEAYSSSASPGNSHTAPQISSTLDLVSLDSTRSQSTASFHSVRDADESDDSSDENEGGLVIDHEVSDNNQRTIDAARDDTNQDEITVTNVHEVTKTPHLDFDNKKSAIKKDIKDDEESPAECKEKDTSRNIFITDLCEVPLLSQKSQKYIPNPDSGDSQVPSNVSCSTTCDTAIDYSLPKSLPFLSNNKPNTTSCDLAVRASNVSNLASATANTLNKGANTLNRGLTSVRQQCPINPTLANIKELEQTPRKKIADVLTAFPRSSFNHSSASSSKLIISPRKPLSRLEGASISRPIPIPSSPHKQPKPASDNLKLLKLTPTSLNVLNKVTRRLRLHEDDPPKRFGSAPPMTSASNLRSLKSNLLPAPETSNEKETDLPEKMEMSVDHSLGSNIPVGIAVAQIRPHHIQQPQRESVTAGATSRNIRQAHTRVGSKDTPLSTPTGATPEPDMPPSLVVAGHSVNPSPWLQQMSFTHHRAMNSTGATFDPRYPISAPNGFKFAHDSLTGQFFLVPSGDFVAQTGVWPASSFAPSAGAGNSHYQTNVAMPTGSADGRGENIGTEKSLTPGSRTDSIIHEQDGIFINRTDSIILEQDGISINRTGLARGVEKHHHVNQPGRSGKSNSPPLGLTASTTAQATIVVNNVTSISTDSPPLLFKAEQPVLESRGCSPIIFEGLSSSLSLLSTLSSLTSKKVITSTVGVQTCDNFIKRSCKRKSSPPKLGSHDQAVQTTPNDISPLNALSVQCPDLDPVDSIHHSLEEKSRNEQRISYNPFTDPQILQAADALELLSALAEKRTKCSSLDDPKRIFPSPSDSFKSDSASIAAIEDTLSPAHSDLKSGQCTPRRDVRRDLSPKWSLSKKEPHSASVFADFKAPTDIEMPDDLEVRVKLAEVQRQYKEKQKELAKLQGNKSDDVKPSKRGPGRPPKKKAHSKKSDDESSSSPSKIKEHHQPQKKKRPAEELVDRVFRKLPPVIKTCNKASRSIHYVKSKTGPFFRRKSASSSAKRNKDLFGFDESNWPSFSERKHQEKVKVTGSFSGKSKRRHRSSSSQSEDSKHSHDAGNIFSNLESFNSDYIERRIPTLTHYSHSHRKLLSGSGPISIRSGSCSISSHQESGLGLLAKFALTVTTNSLSSSSVSLSMSSLATSTSPSASSSGNQSSISSFSSNTFSTNICSGSIYYNSCSNMYSMGSASSGSHAPNITFGSLSSLMSSPSSGLMSFSSPSLTASSLNSSTPTTASASTFAQAAVLASPASLMSPTSTTAMSVTSPSPLFPSSGTHYNSTADSFVSRTNSGMTNSSTNCSRISNYATSGSTASSNMTSSSTGSFRDLSPAKRRHDEADSDTDTSDTSPNKKRKPGRPRKINPEKSSGGTETIWAKKSSSLGLLQVSEPSCALAKDASSRKLESMALKPLFLDEEWARRRSERIFLNEPSPLPSPAVSPSPRGEPVWKLSHFMPKSKKMPDGVKPSKEGGEKYRSESSQEQTQFASVCSALTSKFSSPTVSSSALVKSEGNEHASPLSAISPSLVSLSNAKSTEIVSPKFDDAKLIVKLVNSMKNSPSVSLSSSLLSLSSSSLSLSNSSLSSHNKSKDYDQDQTTKMKLKKIAKSELLSTSSSSSSPPGVDRKDRRAEENSKMKQQKAKSLHDLTQRVKKKFSNPGMRKQKEGQQRRDGRTEKRKRRTSVSCSSDESLPLVSNCDKALTPEPRSCKLQPSDLREGLKVLYLIDGLFHEGTVKALQPPDIYGVLTAGQRGNRPHILCLEELLKWTVLDVRPGSLRYVPEGTRVCTFWSQQFSCLYPGTVAKSTPLYNGKKVIVPVDFDDGDNGRIELDHIRLLPADFPIVEYEPDPLEVLPKRKQRSISETSDARKSTDKDHKAYKHSAEAGNAERESKSAVEHDDPVRTNSSVKRELWKWDGKSTKKPGVKGKAKKSFYKSISRGGKETIKVGDSAVFVSKDRVNCPYIGRIDSLWEGWNGQKMVKVHWYYHPEETESDKKLADPKNALFESHHADENDVQTIAYKCEVIPHANYKKLLNDATKKNESIKANVFYLAGFYDPAVKNITFCHGVSSQ